MAAIPPNEIIQRILQLAGHQGHGGEFMRAPTPQMLGGGFPLGRLAMTLGHPNYGGDVVAGPPFTEFNHRAGKHHGETFGPAAHHGETEHPNPSPFTEPVNTPPMAPPSTGIHYFGPGGSGVGYPVPNGGGPEVFGPTGSHGEAYTPPMRRRPALAQAFSAV